MKWVIPCLVFCSVAIANPTKKCTEDFVEKLDDLSFGNLIWNNLFFKDSNLIKVFPTFGNKDSDKLFTSIPVSISSSEGYTKFLNLVRQFQEPQVSEEYYIDPKSLKPFMDYLMERPEIVQLQQSLSSHKCCETAQSMRETFEKLWFRMHEIEERKVKKETTKIYPKTSAFMLNYVGFREDEDVHGMQSWITFANNQESGKYLYKGTDKIKTDGDVKLAKVYFVEKYDNDKYSQMEDTKLLVGTDPYAEMALFTACYIQAEKCKFKHDNVQYNIEAKRICYEGEFYPNKIKIKMDDRKE